MQKIGKITTLIIVLLFVLSVTYSYSIQGITCNDEVQLRLFSQSGLGNFFHKTIVEENLGKGRVLAILGNVKFLSFISNNTYITKAIEIVFLIAAILLFGLLIKKLTGNKYFAGCVSILTLAFLPITFEHAVPNAFIIITTQPMILLLGSMILFYDYFTVRKRYKLVISVLLFFWAMCLYEFILSYVLAFPAIAYAAQRKESAEGKEVYNKSLFHRIFRYLFDTKWHIVIAILYIILYLLQRVIAPSSYSGNTLHFAEIGTYFNVLSILWKASLPGYYLFNKKFQYLNNIYAPATSGQRYEIYFSIAIFCVLFVYLITYCFIQSKKAKTKKINNIFLFIILFIYSIIPAIPIALTELYQNNVSEQFFTSLPVSLFLYFSLMLLICDLLWKLARKSKILAAIILCIILGFSCVTQFENRVIAEEKQMNFQRFERIEELLKCDYWKQYDGQTIYSPSLYETKNLLAVEDGHWSNYAHIYNNNILFVNQKENESEASTLIILPDNAFILSLATEKIYISQTNPNSHILVQDENKNNVLLSIQECIWRERDFSFYKTEIINE